MTALAHNRKGGQAAKLAEEKRAVAAELRRMQPVRDAISAVTKCALGGSATARHHVNEVPKLDLNGNKVPDKLVLRDAVDQLFETKKGSWTWYKLASALNILELEGLQRSVGNTNGDLTLQRHVLEEKWNAVDRVEHEHSQREAAMEYCLEAVHRLNWLKPCAAAPATSYYAPQERKVLQRFARREDRSVPRATRSRREDRPSSLPAADAGFVMGSSPRRVNTMRRRIVRPAPRPPQGRRNPPPSRTSARSGRYF